MEVISIATCFPSPKHERNNRDNHKFFHRRAAAPAKGAAKGRFALQGGISYGSPRRPACCPCFYVKGSRIASQAVDKKLVSFIPPCWFLSGPNVLLRCLERGQRSCAFVALQACEPSPPWQTGPKCRRGWKPPVPEWGFRKPPR